MSNPFSFLLKLSTPLPAPSTSREQTELKQEKRCLVFKNNLLIHTKVAQTQNYFFLNFLIVLFELCLYKFAFDDLNSYINFQILKFSNTKTQF